MHWTVCVCVFNKCLKGILHLCLSFHWAGSLGAAPDSFLANVHCLSAHFISVESEQSEQGLCLKKWCNRKKDIVRTLRAGHRKLEGPESVQKGDKDRSVKWYLWSQKGPDRAEAKWLSQTPNLRVLTLWAGETLSCVFVYFVACLFYPTRR